MTFEPFWDSYSVLLPQKNQTSWTESFRPENRGRLILKYQGAMAENLASELRLRLKKHSIPTEQTHVGIC
jgi:hypothetical protein